MLLGGQPEMAVGAITRWYHDKSDNSVVVGFQYGRDKVGNPDYELREHQSDDGDEYTYDNLYRLTRTVYDDTSPETPRTVQIFICVA